MTKVSSSTAGDFWAITSYFNPAGYVRRFSNYKIFRKCLKLPLVAVELAYSDDFELQKGDADILVQLRGGSILWQKERLLNVALKSLPESCRKVAWLDCDIVFRNDNWVSSVDKLLDQARLVQLFKNAHYVDPRFEPTIGNIEVEFTRPSSGYVVAGGMMSAGDCFGSHVYERVGAAANGHAWAAPRELLDRHGFYDACIIGGGDRAINCGAYGCFDQFMNRLNMNERQREDYRAWAEPFSKSIQADVAFVEGDILHLWHGDIRDRASRSRQEGLRRFQFDPFDDIAIEENGCWRWNSDKPDMHDYVRNYFLARREDG